MKKIICIAIFGACAAIVASAAAPKVDILVAFDTSARAALEVFDSNTADFAAAQVAKANEVLANSGLGDVFSLRMADVFEWDYTYSQETGFATLLQSITDGDSTDVKALRSARERASADIAVVLVDGVRSSLQKGLSNILSPEVDGSRQYGLSFAAANEYMEWFDDRAYCIVDINSAINDNTFVHEIGHVMGAGHSEIISPSYDEPGPQLYEYSTAWMAQGSDGEYYATVMGYNTTGYADSPRYTVLPYFSSPNLRNPYTGEPLGDEMHDNVRTLSNTCLAVSKFRESKAGSDDGTSQPADDTPTTTAEAAFTARKTTITAAVKDGDATIGLAEFVVAATRKGHSKVSATIFGLDGKKRKAKNAKWQVYDTGDGIARATLENVAVKGMDGTLNITLGSDGSLSDGSLGELSFEASPLGIDGSKAYFWLEKELTSISGEPVVQDVSVDGEVYDALPYAYSPESLSLGAKWTAAKASRLKLKRDRASGTTNLVPTGTTNLSGLKLNYKAKTGTFKGSFTAYAISANGRLKKYKFAVTGVAVDGAGTGIAVCKKTGIELPVTISKEIPCGECTVSPEF